MWNWISKLEELKKKGESSVLVTVTHSSGSTPREPGAKMLVLSNGDFFGTIGGGNLEALALIEAKKRLQEELPSESIRYPLGAKTGQCCGGLVELFFDVLHVGPSIYVFGAGHVGQAVCQTLMGTPFTVHIIDDRKEWILSEKIPSDVIRHESDWREVADTIPWNDKKTYVAVMTHRHDLDQEIIELMIQKPARYIGLIGSESKWTRFKQRLKLKGMTDLQLSKVQCPMGLELGGKAPQEIAISLGAELLREYYGIQNEKIPTHSTSRGQRSPHEEPQGPPGL